MSPKILHFALFLCIAIHGTLAVPPCDDRLCDCFGNEATCTVLPHYDMTGYGLDHDVTKLTVKAPFKSLCLEVKKMFPNADVFFCDTPGTMRDQGTVTDSDPHAIIDLRTVKNIKKIAHSSTMRTDGELAALPSTTPASTISVLVTSSVPTTEGTTRPVTDATTDPMSGATTDSVTDATTYSVTDATTVPVTDATTVPVTDATTVPVTDTSTVTDASTPPGYMTKDGHFKWCIVKSMTCDCKACAERCPCSTAQPTSITERCTPRVIWITPSPPNVTTSAYQSTTGQLFTTPTTISPKKAYMEAVHTVLTDKPYFKLLCEHHAFWPKKEAAVSVTQSTVAPVSSVVEHVTSSVVEPVVELATTTSMHTTAGTTAPPAPTDTVHMASVVRRHSAKSEKIVLDEDMIKKVDRILSIVERILMIAENIQTNVEDWIYKLCDNVSQSGTNLLMFFGAYCMQYFGVVSTFGGFQYWLHHFEVGWDGKIGLQKFEIEMLLKSYTYY